MRSNWTSVLGKTVVQMIMNMSMESFSLENKVSDYDDFLKNLSDIFFLDGTDLVCLIQCWDLIFLFVFLMFLNFIQMINKRVEVVPCENKIYWKDTYEDRIKWPLRDLINDCPILSSLELRGHCYASNKLNKQPSKQRRSHKPIINLCKRFKQG